MLETAIEKAKLAREQAYVPYSGFKVGAAVITKSETIFVGCNIENSSYPLTCCAERVAIFNALAKGEKEFNSIVIIADTEQPVSPCGACRQVMSEFFSENTNIYLMNMCDNVKRFTIDELLPLSFHLNE